MFRSNAKLYERLLDEKDMHIRLLAAEIDWLRAQLGRPSLPVVISKPLTDTEPGGKPGEPKYVSEMEEAHQILQANDLSPAHLPEILDGLGLGNSTFD